MKKSAKPIKATWSSSGSGEDFGPADAAAHEILATRRDLLPSVERIMNAGLGADRTLRALGLFRDSLVNDRDEHRDPRVAIARSMTD